MQSSQERCIGTAHNYQISHAVQSDGWPNPRLKRTFHTCTQAAPGDLRKQWKILVFLHAPPKGGSDAYRQNPTLIEKTFKNLVKMDDFTMTYCASPSLARSGPWLRSRIPQGPPSKPMGNPCVSEVAPLEICWRPQSPRCRWNAYRQNGMLIAEPL